MPVGIDWPALGGRSYVRGPLLPVQDRVLHQSDHGAQDPTAVSTRGRHLQLPGFSVVP